MPSTLVVIPARYASTRFPGKPLALLRGRPIILHVLDGARKAGRVSEIVVATDDERIRKVVENAGGKVVMTSPGHETGTDRVAEVVVRNPCDIIVNVQGDEPFIRGDVIDEVVRLLEEDPTAGMSTLAVRIRSVRDLLDPNCVKVAWGSTGHALYFSRAPIPWHRDTWGTLDRLMEKGPAGEFACFRHIGIYGYRREVLFRLQAAPPEPVERLEKLEQLRALALGIRIRVAETDYGAIGVDTPEDLERAEEWARNISS